MTSTRMTNGIAKAIRDYSDYRRTIRELAFLSDRELSDLGLSRGDIRLTAKAGVALR